MNAKIIGIIVLITALLGAFLMISGNKSTSSKQTQTETKSISKPTNVPTANESKTYTLAQVEEHNSETDCWIAIEAKVYDVTKFVGSHPGGKAILNGCGKDATTLFNERPTNNKGPHPDTARAALEKFFIGNLAQ